MHPSPAPQTDPFRQQPSRVLRAVGLWLMTIVLALGLVLGQSVQAAEPVAGHHAVVAVEGADRAGPQAASAPACHPGVTCLPFMVPEGPGSAGSLTLARALRPVMALPQRRFGGPGITLPPPRRLT